MPAYTSADLQPVVVDGLDPRTLLDRMERYGGCVWMRADCASVNVSADVNNIFSAPPGSPAISAGSASVDESTGTVMFRIRADSFIGEVWRGWASSQAVCVRD